MSVIQQSFEFDEQSYTDADHWRDLQVKILQLLEEAISIGGDESSLFVNYAAVLCNLGRFEEAIRVLRDHPSNSSSYCQNMAIAIINVSGPSSGDEVRLWNKRSSSMPEVAHEITAYVDWHGY